MKNKNTYESYVENFAGASVYLPRTSSIRSAETFARNHYGSGWTVHILRIEIDGDGYSVMGQTEIKTFTIR